MKTILHSFLFTVLLLFPAMSTDAQTPTPMERLNAQKVAFFTERLNLTPEEAQQFWPVYNQYQEEKNAINKEKVAMLQEVSGNLQHMDDDALTALSDKYVDFDLQLAQLQVRYHQKFKQVLPIRKVIRLYQVEKQFTGFLLRQIQNRRENQLQRRRF